MWMNLLNWYFVAGNFYDTSREPPKILVRTALYAGLIKSAVTNEKHIF